MNDYSNYNPMNKYYNKKLKGISPLNVSTYEENNDIKIKEEVKKTKK